MIFTYTLFFFFFLAVIFGIFFSIVIFYHFQEFKILQDKNTNIFLKVFSGGTIIILALALLFLILDMIK